MLKGGGLTQTRQRQVLKDYFYLDIYTKVVLFGFGNGNCFLSRHTMFQEWWLMDNQVSWQPLRRDSEVSQTPALSHLCQRAL